MNYQVIILAGGESSRFYPFNNIHKSFFELGGIRIIERALENIRKTSPSGIIVVLGKDKFEEEKEILSKSEFLKDAQVVCQENPNGMADAILSAEKYIKDSFFVINAQQINFNLCAEHFVKKFDGGKYLAILGSSETDEPQKYGIFEFKKGEVTGITEKPEPHTAPSNKRVVGTYLFAKEFISLLEETPISQYSLESTLDRIAKEGKLASVEMPVDSPSLKYAWDILDFKNLILDDLPDFISDEAVVDKTAVLKGEKIFIEKGAHVYEFSIIEGPAYIGRNAVVGSYCQVRTGSVLEEGAQVERYADIKNSYIGRNTHIHSGFVGDSIIGPDSRIGAEFIVANRRLDRGNIKMTLNRERVDTERTSFGTVIGNNVRIGIKVSTMPGVSIGSGSFIGPQTLVGEDVPKDSIFYADFNSPNTKLKNVK